MEQHTRRIILVGIASGFNDRKPVIFRDDECFSFHRVYESRILLFSRLLHEGRCSCVEINNTADRSMSGSTDCGIHLRAGVETGSASTRAYRRSVLCLLAFLLQLCDGTGSISGVGDLIEFAYIIARALALGGELSSLLMLSRSIRL